MPFNLRKTAAEVFYILFIKERLLKVLAWLALVYLSLGGAGFTTR